MMTPRKAASWPAVFQTYKPLFPHLSGYLMWLAIAQSISSFDKSLGGSIIAGVSKTYGEELMWGQQCTLQDILQSKDSAQSSNSILLQARKRPPIEELERNESNSNSAQQLCKISDCGWTCESHHIGATLWKWVISRGQPTWIIGTIKWNLTWFHIYSSTVQKAGSYRDVLSSGWIQRMKGLTLQIFTGSLKFQALRMSSWILRSPDTIDQITLIKYGTFPKSTQYSMSGL